MCLYNAVSKISPANFANWQACVKQEFRSAAPGRFAGWHLVPEIVFLFLGSFHLLPALSCNTPGKLGSWPVLSLRPGQHLLQIGRLVKCWALNPNFKLKFAAYRKGAAFATSSFPVYPPVNPERIRPGSDTLISGAPGWYRIEHPQGARRAHRSDSKHKKVSLVG